MCKTKTIVICGLVGYLLTSCAEPQRYPYNGKNYASERDAIAAREADIAVERTRQQVADNIASAHKILAEGFKPTEILDLSTAGDSTQSTAAVLEFRRAWINIRENEGIHNTLRIPGDEFAFNDLRPRLSSIRQKSILIVRGLPLGEYRFANECLPVATRKVHFGSVIDLDDRGNSPILLDSRPDTFLPFPKLAQPVLVGDPCFKMPPQVAKNLKDTPAEDRQTFALIRITPTVVKPVDCNRLYPDHATNRVEAQEFGNCMTNKEYEFKFKIFSVTILRYVAIVGGQIYKSL